MGLRGDQDRRARNRLLRIEEDLGSKARFPGVSKFRI